MHGCCSEIADIQLAEDEGITGLQVYLDDKSFGIHALGIVSSMTLYGPYGYMLPDVSPSEVSGAGHLLYLSADLDTSSIEEVIIGLEFHFNCTGLEHQGHLNITQLPTGSLVQSNGDSTRRIAKRDTKSVIAMKQNKGTTDIDSKTLRDEGESRCFAHVGVDEMGNILEPVANVSDVSYAGNGSLTGIKIFTDGSYITGCVPTFI